MANNFQTPAMSLTIPIPGLEPGPQYAVDVSNNMVTIDGHRHTGAPGDGYQVVAASLNINGDVSWQDHNITNLRSSRMINQSGVLTGTADVNIFYVVSGNAYYNNASGTPIALTQGSTVSPAGFTAYTVQADTSATWTILSSDVYNALDCSYSTTGAVTVNLPTSSAVASGRFYVIKDISGNAATHNITVNVAGASGDLIEGVGAFVINNNFGGALFWTDAAGKWYVILSSINLNPASVTVGAGISTSISAQTTSAASTTGGNFTIASGDGSGGGSHPGKVILQCGDEGTVFLSDTSLQVYPINASSGQSLAIMQFNNAVAVSTQQQIYQLQPYQCQTTGTNVQFGGIALRNSSSIMAEITSTRRATNGTSGGLGNRM